MAEGRRVAIPNKSTNSRTKYFKKGVKYEVKGEDEHSFSCVNEDGVVTYCLKDGCSHLGLGGSWELLTERK